MPVFVVIASPKGGTGRTTLTAQLAAAFGAAGKRCLAVDLDPQNTLALALGESATSWLAGSTTQGHGSVPQGGAGASVGIVRDDLTPGALADYLRAQRAQVAHVPFGHHAPGERREIERKLTAEPLALRARINAICPPRCDIVLIDTPAGRNAWSEAALAFADAVLVPITADAACAATLPGYEAFLSWAARSAYPSNVRYLVNLWSPFAQFSVDALPILAEALGERLLSEPVHFDQELRDQLAKGAPLVLEEGSQAAADLRAAADVVSRWLADVASHLLSARTA